MANNDDPFANLTWYDALSFGLEGQAWADVAKNYPASRLPARAQDMVSEDLWNLSLKGNGLAVNFLSDATTLFARWQVEGQCHAFSNAAGGLDCYGKDEFNIWYWVGRTLPWKLPDSQESDGQFNSTPLDGIERQYRVYLPFSLPITSLEIGIAPEATLTPILPRPVSGGKGIVYYGTSIVYGAGVARSGMSHANLLGRWLDQPIINLGFAGRAWLEPEIANLLAELDPAIFILDPLPNTSPEMIHERLGKFISIIRAARPDTPILWVGNRILADAAFQPKRKAIYEAKAQAVSEVIAAMRKNGLANFHELPGGELFGADHEGTVDASHPNELGAYRMARHLLPFIARHLAK